MNKSNLIDIIATKGHMQTSKAEKSADLIFDSIVDALKRDERVEIRNFGSFQNRRYKGYTGRNPKTGEQVEVAPKIAPHFKAGKKLKELVAAPTLKK